MNKRTKSFLLSVLTLSFIFYSCSNLANDLQKRKNQNLFNITIQECHNGTVTVTKASGIKAGEEVILSVTATSGYELKTISVTNTQNKDVAVATMEQGTSYKFTMPASDVTVGAAFDKTGPVNITEPGDLNNSSGDTVYKIEHCQQSLTDTGLYDLVAIQYKRGNAGDQTTAVSSDFPGFTALSFDQQTINSNGNTIVRIYYDRNIITYTFELHGGNWEGSEGTVVVSGLYGATVNKPSRAGYHLSGTIPDTFGADNDSFDTTWTANTNTPYTVRIYLQNVEGGENYTLDNEIIGTGTTDTNTNYIAPSKTGFNVTSFNQVNINGDESTILNVYYNRIAYTVTFVTNGGNSIGPQQILYQASPTQIPVREGYTFYNWYTDSSCNDVFDLNRGITTNITLYAFWIDNSITYKFHETVERLPAGTDGTFGTSGEYVLFGDYPQSLLDNTVTVDENKTMKMGNETVYGGSDGKLYYKYEDNYFLIEPIKWRVISRDEDGNAVLFSERILDVRETSSFYPFYSNSPIPDYLNKVFINFAFTEKAQELIENNIVENDTDFSYLTREEITIQINFRCSYEELMYKYNNPPRNKVYLLKISDFFDVETPFDYSARSEILIDSSDYALYNGCDGTWWLRSYFILPVTNSIYDSIDGVFLHIGKSFDYSFVNFIYSQDYGRDPAKRGIVPAITVQLPEED